jgi:hypothetical protein
VPDSRRRRVGLDPDPVGLPHRLELRRATDQECEAPGEPVVAREGLHRLGRVLTRVDGHRDEQGAVALVVAEPLLRLPHALSRERADVGTVRVQEREGDDLALLLRERDRPAADAVGQREVGRRSRGDLGADDLRSGARDEREREGGEREDPHRPTIPG